MAINRFGRIPQQTDFAVDGHFQACFGGGSYTTVDFNNTIYDKTGEVPSGQWSILADDGMYLMTWGVRVKGFATPTHDNQSHHIRLLINGSFILNDRAYAGYSSYNWETTIGRTAMMRINPDGANWLLHGIAYAFSGTGVTPYCAPFLNVHRIS